MSVVQKKICLLGDFAVGKTSLIRQFVEGKFDDKYLSTIGVKISRKPLERNTHTLNLLIWDIAGGDNQNQVQATYIRGAVGALMVCDLTRAETVAALYDYQKTLHAVNPNAVVVLAGNKADLVDERAIDDEMLTKIGSDLQAKVLLTSAKTGDNVIAAFELLAQQLEVQT
jgi:small GTP-binding protein